MPRRRKLTEKERKAFAKEIERKGRELFMKEVRPQLKVEELRKSLGERMLLKRPIKSVLTPVQEERLLLRASALYKKTKNARFVNIAEDVVAANAKLSEAKPGSKEFSKLLKKRNKLLKDFNEYVELHKVPY